MSVSLSLLCLTKSISNLILFQLCSWPITANMGELSKLSKGYRGKEAIECHLGNLQVSCTPVQVEVDVFYFPILCKFVMDVFFRGFLMDSSDKQNPAFNSCWEGSRFEHKRKTSSKIMKVE